MRLATVLLANQAEVRDGLANITGAFPEWFDVPVLPAAGTLYLVIVLEMERDELDAPVECVLSFGRVGDEPRVLSRFESRRQRLEDDPPDSPLLQIIVEPISIETESQGPHEFLVEFSDAAIEPLVLPILVRLLPTSNE